MKEITVFNRKITLQSFITFESLYFVFCVIAVMSKFLYFQLTTNLNSLSGGLSTTALYMMLTSFGTLLMLLSLTILLFGRKRLLVLLILDLVMTLVLSADTIYFRYYHNAITIPVLFLIGLVGPLGGSIKGLVKIGDIIYLLDIPFMIAGLVFFGRKTVGILPVRRLIAFFAVALSGFIIFQAAYQNINKRLFAYDKNNIIKYMGILDFHLNDIATYTNENMFTSKALTDDEKDKIDDFFDKKNAEDNKEKTGNNSKFNGIAKGKNLIIVQLESIQEFLINRSIEGREITPNLNRLLKDSVYFDNFYYQIGGGNTSDAEFLCNTSLYPLRESAVYFRYPVNTYNALPKLLSKQGYDTNAFHAYFPSFWNRTVMYEALGFDRFYSNKDFKTDEITGWGLGDYSFFRQAVEKLDTGKPFYSFIISLSSHYAYGSFANYSFYTGIYEKTLLGNYFKAANYVDRSIGLLIDELKKRGLYDNSLLVLYGDHYAIPKHQRSDMMKFLGLADNDFEWLKQQKVPLIIHYPGFKNGEAEKITGGQIDILPTVANLMGFKAPFAMGKDLFNTENGYAVLRSSSYITDRYVYISDLETAYDISSGLPLDSKVYEADLKQYMYQLEISDIILKKNAFKK